MEIQDKMQIELETENPIGSDYFHATLYLPATKADIRDAIQRARGFGREDEYQGISVTGCPILPVLQDTRLQAPTIRELNFLATRLEELSEEERLILNAIFQQQKSVGAFDAGISMQYLINLTYGLDEVPIASNVGNDEQLGQLVIDYEMNEDVSSIPENVRYLLDKSHIGRLQRQNDDGVYWGSKYVPTGHYEMPEVYDGVHLPEEPAAIPGAPNHIGGFMDSQAEVEKQKPDCPLIGADGNVFNLIGIASRTLQENGMEDMAKEMMGRIKANCHSYDEALCIIGDYVNISCTEGCEEDCDDDLEEMWLE